MAENTVHAPYNFVPFSEKILIRYSGLSELPRHDRIDPALKSGEIQVELRAETPVFVSDGQQNPHFFRGPDGTYQIPGSTVRGLVRENMQILGFGLVRPGEDLDDVQIYFREMAAARGSTGDALKEYYRGALDIKSGRTPSGKTFTTPQKVQGGYLHREGGVYYIQPIQGEVLRVSRSHPDVEQFGKEDARTLPVSYQAADGSVKTLALAGKAGMAQGELLFTGKSVGKVPNHLYLFPAEDGAAERIDVSNDDVISYQMDLEGRSNALKAYYSVDFWALPKEGERKAVFFIRYEGHTYFGRSRFLRIGYRYPLSQGLPQHHREYWNRGDPALDYPSAVLGFARGQVAYRSRVSFGDFRLEGMAKELPPVQTVLGDPKPSYYPGYVEEGKHYNEDDFRLRGYKQYWLKEAGVAPLPEGKDKVGSTLRPLDRGSVFRGTIRYRNLTKDELGLLLWAIRLDEGCFQTLGMGKPYGYGRMKATILALQELDPETLYTPAGLCGSLQKSGADAVEQYIRAYDAYAADTLHVKKPKKRPSLRSRNEIQDFFFLKRTVRPAEEVSYMELGVYKKIRSPLETVQTAREQAEQEPTQAAPEDPMAALRDAINARKL